MTPKDVQERIEEIKGLAGDDELAHSAEDDLHTDVLKAIAEGKCKNAKECARLALTTSEISFYRWYA